MKKIKTALMILCCLFSSLIFFACDKTIKVDNITLNSYDIVLRAGEEFDLNVTIGPDNATNKNIDYILTDESIVSLVIDSEDPTKATLKASENIIGPVSTFLQVVSEDENARSQTAKITVYTEKVQLAAPVNITYDVENELITWDLVDSSSGYKLYIEIDGEGHKEVNCATNSYKIDEYYDKIISVKVKSIGDGIVYTDSEYSNLSFKFIQLEETEFFNEGRFIKFNKIPNAKGYNLFVYDTTIKQQPDYTYYIDDTIFNPEVGFELELLENAGKTYIIKIQTLAKDFENVTEYPSKTVKSITINKIATPIVANTDFKFAYSTKTLSWKNLPYATGYAVIRNKVNSNGNTIASKVYELGANQNLLTIDTAEDKLEAGLYNYSLKVLGNNKEYLDSNISNPIELEKLAAPTFSVYEGDLVWSRVDNIGGYLFGIDGQTPTQLSSETNSFALGASFRAKEYQFVIASVGNGTNTITSEFSEIFSAEKLVSPETPTLSNNKMLNFTAVSDVAVVKAYITHNNGTVYTKTFNALTLENEVKTAQLDMSDAGFDSGNYNVYCVAYRDGYLKSENSATFSFTKLQNTQTVSIRDGKLTYSLVNNATNVELYINGTQVTRKADKYYYIDNGVEKEYIFKAGEEFVYNLQLKYIPTKNTNRVISNLTKGFEFSKLATPQKLYIENGVIKYYSNSEIGNKFEVQIKNDIVVNRYNNLNQIKLQPDTIYTIKMYHDGGTQYLSSDYSNSITVKLLDKIDDLTLNGDIVSFNDIQASKYFVYLETNEGILQKYNEELFSTSFEFSKLIKRILPQSYNNLTNPIKIYVVSQGGSLLEPQNNEDIITLINRQDYSNGLNNMSNIINIKLLSSPTNLRVTNITDLMDDYNLEVNKLYFDCKNTSNLFELSYTDKNNQNYSQTLSVGNGISVYSTAEGVNTYLIDTDFLSAGVYNFTIKAVAQTKVETQPASNITYNVNSLDSVSLNEISKLNAIDSIVCEEGRIVINDADAEENVVYLLAVNGQVIFDDILEENQDLNYILNLVESGNISNMLTALDLINQFKTTTRTLPNKYRNTFNLSAYKILIPEINIKYVEPYYEMVGGHALSSDFTDSIKITRINAPSIVLKDGFIEWNAVENAEKYIIFVGEKVGQTVDYKTPIEINANVQNYEYDLYGYLNGKAGNYVVYMLAVTNKDNYLSSLNSSLIDFEILKTPTLRVENGVLTWNSVTNAAGYELNVYRGNDTSSVPYTFEFNNSVEQYDCMKDPMNYVLESGNYTFTITALGTLEGAEESSVLSSLLSNSYTATKLETPQPIYVSNGKIVLTNIATKAGVKHYKLNINDVSENVIINGNTVEIELAEKYVAGNYTFSYQAIGKGNYLTGNVSTESFANKLNPTSQIYVYNGEIYWNSVSVENYNNNNSTSMNYMLNVKKGNPIKSIGTTSTAYIMSQDDDVASGLYTLEVKTLGDSNFYLNSNLARLENVVKLDHIKDFRIENGKLVWTSPSIITGTQNLTLSSPNGLYFTLEKDGVKKNIRLNDGVDSFVFDDTFEAGIYRANIYNIGNAGALVYGYNFVNSKVIDYKHNVSGSSNIRKLEAPINLNINDGINLSWNDPNEINPSITDFIVNLTQNIQNESVSYSGILSSNSSSIIFEKICYYIDETTHERILIINDYDKNKNQTNVTLNIEDGKYYYKDNFGVSHEVQFFNYAGSSFDVQIFAYGDIKFITSDASNMINIVMPDAVTNLKVEHGKITWTEAKDATGYILTISRIDAETRVEDEEYNNYNARIYVNGKTYYNLTDVNYIYTISVKAYAIAINDDEQTMASEPRTIEDYLFNSFSEGNGSDENPYLIYNESELSLIKYNHFATYKIMTDITLNNNFSTLFDKDLPFVGKLLGNNKTLTNLTIQDYKEYSGMFGYISGSTIIDDRVVYNYDTDEYEKITKSVTYLGEVSNLSFVNVDISVGVFVGTIAGYNEGLIDGINISGTVRSTSEIDADIGASSENVYSGSVVGQNAGTIKNVINNASIAPTANTGLYSGGITAKNSGLIYNCTNNGRVAGTLAGGVVAINATDGKIEAVKVTGDIICFNFVSNDSKLVAIAGGIAAQNQEGAIITNCIVDNERYNEANSGILNTSETLISTNTIYMGGLVGENAGTVHNNLVRIKLYSDPYNYGVKASVGKLIGYNQGTVSYNYGLAGVQGDAQYSYAAGNAIDSTNNTDDILVFSIELVTALNQNKNNVNLTWQIVDTNINIAVNN